MRSLFNALTNCLQVWSLAMSSRISRRNSGVFSPDRRRATNSCTLIRPSLYRWSRCSCILACCRQYNPSLPWPRLRLHWRAIHSSHTSSMHREVFSRTPFGFPAHAPYRRSVVTIPHPQNGNRQVSGRSGGTCPPGHATWRRERQSHRARPPRRSDRG